MIALGRLLRLAEIDFDDAAIRESPRAATGRNGRHPVRLSPRRASARGGGRRSQPVRDERRGYGTTPPRDGIATGNCFRVGDAGESG
jgi:hypothetical protein